jgi:hypothetical protein
MELFVDVMVRCHLSESRVDMVLVVALSTGPPRACKHCAT